MTLQFDTGERKKQELLKIDREQPRVTAILLSNDSIEYVLLPFGGTRVWGERKRSRNATRCDTTSLWYVASLKKSRCDLSRRAIINCRDVKRNEEKYFKSTHTVVKLNTLERGQTCREIFP